MNYLNTYFEPAPAKNKKYQQKPSPPQEYHGGATLAEMLPSTNDISSFLSSTVTSTGVYLGQATEVVSTYFQKEGKPLAEERERGHQRQRALREGESNGWVRVRKEEKYGTSTGRREDPNQRSPTRDRPPRQERGREGSDSHRPREKLDSRSQSMSRPPDDPPQSQPSPRKEEVGPPAPSKSRGALPERKSVSRTQSSPRDRSTNSRPAHTPIPRRKDSNSSAASSSSDSKWQAPPPGSKYYGTKCTISDICK